MIMVQYDYRKWLCRTLFTGVQYSGVIVNQFESSDPGVRAYRLSIWTKFLIYLR